MFLGLKPIFELKIELYFCSILDCNLSGWWNGLKFGADVLWQIPNNIQKCLFAIWSHFEVLLGLKPNFEVGKCVIFGDFLRFWVHWLTKWLENWHIYTFSYAPQDLLKTFSNLRPFWGTFCPKTDFLRSKNGQPAHLLHVPATENLLQSEKN